MFKELFTEGLNEASKPGKVEAKDWTRMMDLVLADKEGANVAKSIKDKHKAIARFVAGNRLQFGDGDYSDIKWDNFGDFKDKAIELGATEEEIKKVYNNTKIPSKVFDKYKSLKDKKLNNRFVGKISKKILDMGFDIKFLPHNGDAITSEGRYAMERNGRKWTIGYKTELTKGDTKLSFVFDAITDESVDDRPTYYVVDTLKNLTTGDRASLWDDVIGQREFIKWIDAEIGKYK